MNLNFFSPFLSHINGNGNINEENEETDEEQEIEEEEVVTLSKPPKVENNMNAKRWKWEVLDD